MLLSYYYFYFHLFESKYQIGQVILPDLKQWSSDKANDPELLKTYLLAPPKPHSKSNREAPPKVLLPGHLDKASVHVRTATTPSYRFRRPARPSTQRW